MLGVRGRGRFVRVRRGKRGKGGGVENFVLGACGSWGTLEEVEVGGFEGAEGVELVFGEEAKEAVEGTVGLDAAKGEVGFEGGGCPW